MMKKIFLGILALGSILSFANSAQAVAGSLPEKTDPFWQVMSQLSTPEDPTCPAKVEAILTAALVPDAGVVANAMCNGIKSSVAEAEAALDAEGVDTNLFDATDWHNISGLYFEIAGKGKIEFTKPIDFMSYEFMTFMSDLSDRLGMAQGEIGLDADIVGGLSGYGAVLTMYNAGEFTDPEILVDGEQDSEGVVSGLEYDPDTNNITFDAAHFTTFKAAEKSSGDKKPKISNVKTAKYKDANGRERLELTITGKHFKKNSKVTLGGKKAHKLKFYNSKKIVVVFTLDKLQKKNKSMMKLKIRNGDETKKYKKEINITK